MMNSKQKEYYLNCCHDISMTTETECMLYDYNSNAFYGENFHLNCPLYKKGCQWQNNMCTGIYEAHRWEGKYIFRCNRGLIFIVVSIFNQVPQIIGSLINGPFLIGDRESALFLIRHGGNSDIDRVPAINGAMSQSFLNLWTMLCNSKIKRQVSDDTLRAFNVVFNDKYDYTEIIKKENLLNRYIASGKRNDSKKILEELIEHIEIVHGDDMEYIFRRGKELLSLISRGVIECGGAVEVILEKNEEEIEILNKLNNKKEVYEWIRDMFDRYMNFILKNVSSIHRKTIIKMANYVDANYTEKLTLEEIVNYLYISKSYFCKILKDEFNCTFVEYVNHVKINKSCDLLEDDRLSISNVANIIGFCDQSYYTKVFKKQIGISPKQYRLRYLSLKLK